MTRIALILAVTSMVACSNKDEDTGSTGGTDPVTGDCEATQVKSTVPENGATDAYYRMAVEFVLDKADDSATFTVTDAAGGAVSGTQTTSDDGKTVYFTPDTAFTPSTSYSATLETCFGSPAIEFTTSALGTATTCDVVGNTYAVDLATARFVEPATLGDLIGEYLTEQVLIGVDSEDSSGLWMLGSVAGDDGQQNFCDPTINFPEAADYSEAPYFIVGPDNTVLAAAGYEIPVNNLMISGTFASDCSYFGGGVLAGELDARDLGPLVEPLVGTGDPDEICGLLAGFGVSCSACSADAEPYCVTLRADQIVADQVAGVVLECVAESDCHPQCETVGKECDTDDYPEC